MVKKKKEIAIVAENAGAFSLNSGFITLINYMIVITVVCCSFKTKTPIPYILIQFIGNMSTSK